MTSNSERGFTLIELLIVVAIITIIASVRHSRFAAHPHDRQRDIRGRVAEGDRRGPGGLFHRVR